MSVETTAASPGYAEHKDELLARLARIEGQVRGIARMVDEERYCIDVLTQLGAVEAALEAVGLELLGGHVRHCVTRALATGEEAEAGLKTEELLEAVRRFAKVR